MNLILNSSKFFVSNNIVSSVINVPDKSCDVYRIRDIMLNDTKYIANLENWNNCKYIILGLILWDTSICDVERMINNNCVSYT